MDSKKYQKEYRERNKEKLAAYRKEYYKNNKEKYYEYNKQWAKDNPEKKKEAQKRYDRTHKRDMSKYKVPWFEANFEKRLLAQAKSTSKVRGLEFNIDVSDITIPEICPFLKVPLSRKVLVGRIPNRASIDRRDSSKGYVKGNVQVISNKANRMKNDATPEELLTFARSILELHEKGAL